MVGGFVLGWLNGLAFGLLLPFTCNGIDIDFNSWWIAPVAASIITSVSTGPALLLIASIISIVVVPVDYFIPLLMIAASVFLVPMAFNQPNLLE
jgi:hypothetical protein